MKRAYGGQSWNRSHINGGVQMTPNALHDAVWADTVGFSYGCHVPEGEVVSFLETTNPTCELVYHLVNGMASQIWNYCVPITSIDSYTIMYMGYYAERRWTIALHRQVLLEIMRAK